MAEHLQIPFALDPRGQIATVTQDTTAEIGQCVRTLLVTPVGTRIEVYDYGVPDPEFTDLRQLPGQVASAISRWEPRATGADIRATTSDGGGATINVRLPTHL